MSVPDENMYLMLPSISIPMAADDVIFPHCLKIGWCTLFLHNVAKRATCKSAYRGFYLTVEQEMPRCDS